MKFKELYNDRKEKRSYVLGEDKKEYFFYHDRTGYTVREMSKDDVNEWFDVMKKNDKAHTNPIQMAICKAAVCSKVEQMINEGSKERTMLIFNPAGELIGSMDFTEMENCKAGVEIYIKDQETINRKGENIVNMIKRMQQNERIYDEIFLIGKKKNRFDAV